MNSINFKITNLTCEACVKLSTVALKRIPGVELVEIDINSGDSNLLFNGEISWDQIEKALSSVGKTAIKN